MISSLSQLANRWPELSALLDVALDLAPEERVPWVHRLEGRSDEFKRTLLRLLESYAAVETKAFLESLPMVEDVSEAAQHLAAGKMVGPYRLVRELGRGGMGAVWLAERADGAFTRQVAVKLPLLTRLRPELAARFIRERAILIALPRWCRHRERIATAPLACWHRTRP